MAKEPKAKDAEKDDRKDEQEAAAPAKPAALKLRPAAGGTVRNPETGKPLAPDGETVKPSRYWDRQLRRGWVEAVGADEPAE